MDSILEVTVYDFDRWSANEVEGTLEIDITEEIAKVGVRCGRCSPPPPPPPQAAACVHRTDPLQPPPQAKLGDVTRTWELEDVPSDWLNTQGAFRGERGDCSLQAVDDRVAHASGPCAALARTRTTPPAAPAGKRAKSTITLRIQWIPYQEIK